MTTKKTTRPEPGKLPQTRVDASSAYERDRAGDTVGALLVDARNRRDKAANSLHYRLRTLAETFDLAARKLEDDKEIRRFPISLTSHIYEMPVVIQQLDQAIDAYNDMVMLAEHTMPPTNVQAAFAMEQTAAMCDALIERMSLKGEHPISTQLREAAKQLVEEQRTAEAVRHAQQQAERDAKRAKRNARPLGKVERDILARMVSYGPLTAYLRGAQQNAVESLVERGFIERHNPKAGREYRLTVSGKAAADSLITA